MPFPVQPVTCRNVMYTKKMNRPTCIHRQWISSTAGYFTPQFSSFFHINIGCSWCLVINTDVHNVIISVSLSISIASVRGILTELSPRPSVCMSVCPESVLWQNSWMDPDVIWDSEWGWSRDGCIRWGWWLSKGKGLVWGVCGVSHCNHWGRCCVVVR